MLNRPESTIEALKLLRTGTDAQWYIVPITMIFLYIYFNEISKKNWKGVAAGLSLYMVHWFYEIMNALIQHFFGHALWTIPTGTSLLLLVGVGIELSVMFATLGLIFSKLLPEDRHLKIFGINNRIVIAVASAAFLGFSEIAVVNTPIFAWVYPWWGSIPVFITVYIPFFLISMLCHDWKPKIQIIFIGSLAALNATMMIVFAGILKWI